MAWTATTLAVTKLFLEMDWNGLLAILFVLGLIAYKVVAARKKRRKRESSSTLSSSSSGINYDVFLNFRGKDTRKEFTDILHKKLKDAGIEVFKDDEKLRAGDKIDVGLKEAIKRSRVSIAIFSNDYASSKSCLTELVQMWQCRESDGQIIIPIFYDVRPYVVKQQADDFAKSFERHEADRKINSNTIEQWREVLKQVAELSGYDREIISGGQVTVLLEKVLKRVRQVLKKDDQVVTDKLVGIDRQVQEMMTKLGVVYSQGQAIRVCGEDVRFLGICGMPGVGKTTLAKVVFNKMHDLFDGCSFLEDINSRGVKDSQEMLIAYLQKEDPVPLKSSSEGTQIISSRFSRMKVLIVLDNVHKDEQIVALAKKPSWFGQGSRIIVTTDDRNVLNAFNNFEECKVEPMEDHHALELFHKHVCENDAPPDVPEFDSLSRDTVKALRGLPMAIVVQARYLKNAKEVLWISNLKYLEDHPPDKAIEAAFEASYKSLDDRTKDIFLDIACFFNGKDERIPPYMWEAWDCDPPRAIKRLRDMHFLEDKENNELRMHNLWRDFGRKLVQKRVLHERCRIWSLSDARSILKESQRNERVQGISLTVEEGGTVRFTCEELGNILNLRYLRLDGANIEGTSNNLLPLLMWLDWREHNSIPMLGNLHLKKLVILDLSRSRVTKDSLFLERAEKLKVLNLQGCSNICASLNFMAPVNLELLILEDCTQLSEIGTFISKLESLRSLNLRKCKRVKQLPDGLHRMKFLTELLIDGTGITRIHIQNNSLKKLEKLSACECEDLKDISTIGRLENLTSLALDSSLLEELPGTFEFPPKLRSLSLRNCSKFNELPDSIGKLGQLQGMDLSHTGITVLPQSVKNLSNLKTLKMAHTHLQNFPEDIANLGKLEEIDFSGCRSMKGQVCQEISGLSSLRILRLSSSKVAALPQSLCQLSHLQTLDILKCNELQALPQLPSSLLSLCWGSKNMTVPDLSYLTSLKELCLNDDGQPEAGPSNRTPNIGWITSLPSLETLELSLPNVPNLPGNFGAINQLWKLSLSNMKELDLAQLPSSLLTLHLKCCEFQEPKFSGLRCLSKLALKNCNVAEISGLENSRLLEVLEISHCSSLTSLNGLEKIGRLRKVHVEFSPLVALPELSECIVEIYK